MLNIQNKLTLAGEEVALGNFDSAIEYIDEILELHPSNKEALWQRFYIPYQYFIQIICSDFKIEKEIASSESYEIDYDLTPHSKKINDLKTESLFYIKTYFQISTERERNELFHKLEKAKLLHLVKNNLNYLLELDAIALNSNSKVSALILEYCNKIYLDNLKHRRENPPGIINLKNFAEENLKRTDPPMYLEMNENFNDTKIWMERILAEDEAEKRKKKQDEESGKKRIKINPVYVFSFFIILIIAIFFILYKILLKYT